MADLYRSAAAMETAERKRPGSPSFGDRAIEKPDFFYNGWIGRGVAA
jgi:hypothetical protein